MTTVEEKEEQKKKKAAKIEESKRLKRKLLLWYTHDLKPLFSHKELEPIMATLGFFPLPILQNQSVTNFRNVPVAWKEYQYAGAATITTRTGPFRSRPHLTLKPPLPTPRLPYPRIDGLHLFTYKAFMDAVNFYLRRSYFGDLFHLWELPIHPIYDKRLSWDFMSKNHLDVVYRLGTLDDRLLHFYSMDEVDYVAGKRFETMDDCLVDDPKITVVSMDDIVIVDRQMNDSSSSQDHGGTATH